MAGQQQAVAANKALAATLGGRDARWSKWGGGASASELGTKGKESQGKAPANRASEGGEDAGPATVTFAEETPGAGLGASGSGAGAGSGALAASRSRGDLVAPTSADVDNPDVQLQDLVVALQQDPMYCRSTMLYRLINGL